MKAANPGSRFPRDLAADWRRWTVAERITVTAIAAVLAVGTPIYCVTLVIGLAW